MASPRRHEALPKQASMAASFLSSLSRGHVPIDSG